MNGIDETTSSSSQDKDDNIAFFAFDYLRTKKYGGLSSPPP